MQKSRFVLLRNLMCNTVVKDFIITHAVSSFRTDHITLVPDRYKLAHNYTYSSKSHQWPFLFTLNNI